MRRTALEILVFVVPVVLTHACGCARADEPTTDRAPARAFDPDAYEKALAGLEADRVALGARFRAATDDRARATIRSEARHLVVKTILDEMKP